MEAMIPAVKSEPSNQATNQLTSTPKPVEGPGMTDQSNLDVTRVLSGPNRDPCLSPAPENGATELEGDTIALDQTTNNSEIVKDRAEFKNEFSSLNHRFVAYVQKVKTIDKKLEESEKARKDAEEQLSQLRSETTQQMDMLRNEVEHHIRQAVQTEEKIGRMQKDIDNSKAENRILRSDLEHRRQREASLERTLVSERSAVRSLRDENAKLREQRRVDEKDRKNLCDQITQLKVEIATMNERVKMVNFERTMLESKIVEVDKKAQFSAEDLEKRVAAEKRQLEKLGMEKLEEIRSKHRADIERLKMENNRKIQDALQTYVSAEEHARLETLHQQALKRAQDAETLVAERDVLVNKIRANLEEVKAAKEKECAAERRRRDKLQKRLNAQKQSYNDIQQELQTYRQLIDSLDLDDEALANTPIGAKRPRTLMGATSTSRLNEAYSKSPAESPASALKARQVLVRRALTPKQPIRKRLSLAGPSNEPEEDKKPDCGVM